MKLLSNAAAYLFWTVSMASRKAEAEIENRSIAEHSDNLISWLHSFSSGFINPKVQFRHLDENDPTSFFGAFVTEDMSMNELIMRIPHQMLIDSREQNPIPSAMVCGLVYNLIEQFELGEESEYSTYTKYLKDTQPPGMLPSAWSDEGKNLLLKVLGDHQFDFDEWLERYQNEDTVETHHEFPPTFVIGWIEDDWYRDCDGDEDPLSEYAALLVVQRAWDDVLIPIFDMFSHRNGHWLNTKSNSVHAGSDVTVRAKRNIKAGEQLYTSYNMCEDCANRVTAYGTPEIFRDYGFVEQFPQSWIFRNLDIRFRIDEVYDEEAEQSSLVITEWIENEPTAKQRGSIEKALRDVQINKEMYLGDRSKWEDVPDTEWSLIEEFIDAMQIALNLVVEYFLDLDLQDSCVMDRSCNVSMERYEDLNKTFETYAEKYYFETVFDFKKSFSRFEHYETVEFIESQYQEISFLYSEKDDDTCMDLDNTIQICTQYRPHYHELGVHYPARFLPAGSLKRVLFVGGGDSMLLHEILKYDSVEKVVGLEIDQKVVRGAFKHFGTLPHFDDPRVEWWFGDASKSILLLPNDYFGSFDLVLVDLSETVSSFKVTDSLDVLEALTLLTKDDGIFVKNEVYHRQFSAMFEYSAQVVLYQNPVIGAQVMVMGSRTIDFMTVNFTDHFPEVNPNLLIRPLDEIRDKFELFHDYAHNTSSLSVCDIYEASSEEPNSDDQLRSPGIILIAEAENVSMQLTDSDSVQEALANAIKRSGLKISSEHLSSSIPGDVLTFLTNAGYVIARTERSKAYVGIDIHFWSLFQLQNKLLNSILEALGSDDESVTTYRVIAGGVFNAPSWKNDALMNGPHVEDACNSYAKTGVATELDIDKPNIEQNLLLESLKIVPGDNIKLLVLAGNDRNSFSEKDKTFVMSKSSVAEIVTLSCPSLENFIQDDDTQALADCERLLQTSIVNHANDGKFNAIFIDSSADEILSSIFLKCFTIRSAALRDQVLVRKSLIISLNLKKNESWRQNLLRHFKSDVFEESPASYAEVLVQENDEVGRLLLTNGFNWGFVGNLDQVVAGIDAIGLSAKVDLINGAEWLYQDPFRPRGIAKMSDYDSSESSAQWDSQDPVGHQTILQLESKRALSKAIIKRSFVDTIANIDIGDGGKDEILQFDDVGDGLVLMVSWPLGNIALLWDGRMHIDMNIFTFFEDVEFVDTILQRYKKGFRKSRLDLTLRDDQPRGVGGMISYGRDFDFEPIWANID